MKQNSNKYKIDWAKESVKEKLKTINIEGKQNYLSLDQLKWHYLLS